VSRASHATAVIELVIIIAVFVPNSLEGQLVVPMIELQ